MATSAGFQSISLLNVNALYIQGVPFNDNQPSLQAEIDAINAQLVGIEAVTNKIDTTGLTLPPQCIITNATTNQALKTLIDNINVDIAKLNKFDLTGLPAPQTCIITTATTNQALQTQIDNITVGFDQKFDLSAIPAQPPGAIVITPTTTNQALKTLIDANTASVAKFDLTAMAAAPPATITITPTTTNQALKTLIDTNATNITTIQGQITTINGQITTINNKIAHWNNFTFGSDSMCGVNDGTGFAVALSGSAAGNGIFVYPNNSTVLEQIQLAVANDKEILIRGGNAVKIYGNNDGSITSRNIVEIGDKTDAIKIGTNNGGLVDFPDIEIGVDGTLGITRDSSLGLKGDIYFSNAASSTGATFITPYTPVLIADTTVGTNFANCNKFTTDPTFSGLDVVAINPIALAPITLTASFGAIPITAAVGLISLTALAGGITLATAAGVMTMNCGAGGLLINGGAGVMNIAQGSGNINMTTIGGDIVLGAGKAVGGTAGNTTINALQKVTIQPDIETEIYKAAFIELNDNAAAPPITANRLYQQADGLYWNGQLVQGGSSNQYVLKAGDTMTGALTLPEAIAAVLTLDNLTVAPNPVTNRLYLLNGVLYFNGSALGGGGGSFVLKTGDTMTGALNISYDAGQVTPQLNLVNTNNTAPVATQGATIVCRNDAAGIGSVGERCGQLVFSGKDSVGNGGRSYGSVQGFINDPTTSAIDGRMAVYVASNNSQVEMLRLLSTTTAVRQCNISANYTTIGANALGSTATSNLTVQGTTNSTVSLQTPQINSCPEIYPATSTTLVDGAVKRYRPERLFTVTDYPNPLTAPTIPGEKCVVLNAGGNPVSEVDSILQSSDFPSINGAILSKIVDVRYVEKTALTPAMNVITALYNEPNQQGHMFVQPDVPGQPLTLTRIADFYFAISGQALVTDFVVTTFQNTTRIYAVGQFDTVASIGTAINLIPAHNFSGQLVVSWSGVILQNVIQNAMPSNSTTQDVSPFTTVEGLQGTVYCILNMTGYSGIPQPAQTLTDKYDSLVIGGTFTAIGTPLTPPLRPLSRLAYYDWNNASSGGQIGWRSFQDTNWSVPEGPNGYITGGQPAANGAMLFAYTGYLVGATTSYYGFALQYTAGFAATWTALNNDSNAISTGSNFGWFASLGRNTVSGGNPVLPYGAGNAIGYNEVYFNCGYDSGTLFYGCPFRPTAADPYEITDSLVVDALNFQFPTYQLRPQFSGTPIYSVYRDDTHYPNVFFCAGGSQLRTATLPFGPSPPNYNVITLQNPAAPIPCFSFGGYSTEVGYTGAIFGTDTNAYVYKLTSVGELTIELSGCVVRTYNDVFPQNPIVATNKLTFPLNTDGGSVVLCGDTSTVPASWWAISQDGPLYYDTTLIGGGGGLDSITASGAGITAVTTGSNVVIANTGVTSIIAGTGIAVNVGTGAVTVSAATAPSGTLICQLGKINFSNLNTGQPSTSSYIPLYDGATAPKQSGICTIGPSNFTLTQDSFNQYTYLTWQGVNPITVNIKVDCSWYSTSGTPFPTGADSEFTNTNTFVNSYAYSAVNFGIEIQDSTVPGIQTFGTSLGNSAINWLASYGGTLSGTGSMKTGSYLRFSARTNYSFNNTYGAAGTYFASLNFGGADQLTITAYESPYPV